MKSEEVLHYLFSNRRTELAVLASSPVVGSSRNRTEGSMISSIPMFVLFLSPPEMPRVICVPTWGKTPIKEQHNLSWSMTHFASLEVSFSDGDMSDVCVRINLGISHFGETQFFDEVIDSSLLVALRHGAGQSQSCRKVKIFPHSQCAHDHVFLSGRQKHVVYCDSLTSLNGWCLLFICYSRFLLQPDLTTYNLQLFHLGKSDVDLSMCFGSLAN